MSSAAVAAANIAVPPEGTSENGIIDMNGVASAIIPDGADIPNRLVPDKSLNEDDDDSDVGTKIAKRKDRRRQLEENDQDGHLEVEEDLFGEEDDDQAQPTATTGRRLEDEDLDSGDDLERNDRAQSPENAEAADEVIESLVEYPSFARQPLPQPSDGEMYLLKIPRFMSIEASMFHTPSFQVPTTEHHSRRAASATFSAFNTAMSTIRWRHSPSNPEELQSNARILRWSDGSLTLQLGSDATQQYEIDGKPLAPPQKAPAKPTPSSLKKGEKQTNVADSYSYLAVPEAKVGLLRTSHKITTALTILPSKSTKDDAEERLRQRLAAAVSERSSVGGISHGIEFRPLDKAPEDPEKQRQKAEEAEKQLLRQKKKRDAADERALYGTKTRGTGMGRLSGGLTAGMLEDDETGTPSGRAKQNKSRRRAYHDEYSEDEDMGRKKGNFAADEYEKDDFVAGSDEEEEELDEEEMDESDPDEGMGHVAAGAKAGAKAASPKRTRADDEDVDAAGEPDDDAGAVQGPKRKQRRVIDDDDE